MRKGFTLVELIGVIALLGVIMLVAVPSLIQSNKTSKVNEKNEFKKIVTEACETYVQVNSENDELQGLFGSENGTYTFSTSVLASEGYLKGSLKDPDKNITVKEDTSNNLTAKNESKMITCTYNG